MSWVLGIGPGQREALDRALGLVDPGRPDLLPVVAVLAALALITAALGVRAALSKRL